MTAEMYLDGGLYYEGHDTDGRTDVSLQGVGKGEAGNPFGINLNIVTGSGTYCLCGTVPDDMIRLGRWLVATAEEIKDELEKQFDGSPATKKS